MKETLQKNKLTNWFQYTSYTHVDNIRGAVKKNVSAKAFLYGSPKY